MHSWHHNPFVNFLADATVYRGSEKKGILQMACGQIWFESRFDSKCIMRIAKENNFSEADFTEVLHRVCQEAQKRMVRNTEPDTQIGIRNSGIQADPSDRWAATGPERVGSVEAGNPDETSRWPSSNFDQA